MRRALTVLSAVTVLSAAAVGAASAGPPAGGAGDEERVIVQVRGAGDVPALAAAVRGSGGSVEREYRHVLTGVAATLPAPAVEALRRNPAVTAVVPDGTATLDAGTPWGLDRIDQRTPALDGRYDADTTGAGVTAYVVDSGINTAHADFGGRASLGVNLVDSDPADCIGHGTHVAGVIGGTTHGVAKGVSIVGVKVFGCTRDIAASWSTIIAGLDWVVAHRSGPAVVNMSLSGSANPAMDDAVARATAAGVVVVVSAGNDGYDACQKSPARAPSAITNGATDRSDARWASSNYGPCLDLFAPGVDIPGPGHWDSTGTFPSSGTSMATAHVSGAVARHLQADPQAEAAVVDARLTDTATRSVVLDARSTEGHLLHLAPGASTAPVVTAPDAPTAVKASAGPTSVTLTWQPPVATGGAPVSGYRVCRVGSPECVRLPESARGHTLTGLARRTAYTLSVAAENSAGAGATAEVTTRTK